MEQKDKQTRDGKGSNIFMVLRKLKRAGDIKKEGGRAKNGDSK